MCLFGIWVMCPQRTRSQRVKKIKNKNRKPTSQAIADFPCKYLENMAHPISMPFLKGRQKGKYLFPQTLLITLSADPLQSLQSQM